MAEAVNAMIKVQNADKEGVDQFITERFNDVFGSARLKPLENGKISYKGGSFMKPYGFKALSTVQLTPDDSAIVKLWGRPTMYPMAYLALLMLIGGGSSRDYRSSRTWVYNTFNRTLYVSATSRAKTYEKENKPSLG